MTRIGSVIVAAVALALATPGFAELQQNIEYGHADGERLLLDVHVPDGNGPFPVAILVHGGGWSSGDKAGSNRPGDGADISPWFDLFSGASYTWFSINYRMAPKHRWPADIDDVDAAIRWVAVHAREYKGDPHRIVLVGHSAGGHLVMFASTQSDTADQVRAVIGFAPVTDLVADSERRGGVSPSLQNLFGLPKAMTRESRAILWDASPIAHVHPGMPAILIVHGDADRTVAYQQSADFIAAVRKAGVPCELVTRPGVPHSLVAGEKIDASYRPAVLEWLRKTLEPTAATGK